MSEAMFAKPENAPGCFGFASAFSLSGPCKSCHAAEGCQERAGSAVKLMNERRVEAAALLALASVLSGCGTAGTILYCIAVDHDQSRKCQ